MTCALAGPVAALAQEASTTAAEEKLLRDRAVGALTRKDLPTLFAVMDQYRALAASGAQIPAGLFFAEADAARSSGDPVRAERAFNDFFRVSNPEGAAFNEAMRTYGEFRASLAESTWPILEGMTPIAGSAPSAAPTPATGSAASGEPQQPVAPFSLARRPVTRAQFAEFVAASGYQPAPAQDTIGSDCRKPVAAPESPVAETAAAAISAPDAAATTAPDAAVTTPLPAIEPSSAAAPATTTPAEPRTDDPMTCVGWSDAVAYIDWLRKSTGVRFRLPEATEWQHATRTARIDGVSTGAPPWEWVADCAVTSGVGVTPDATIEANRDSCVQRVTLSDGAAAADAPTSAKTRQSRPPLHRAPDLGFRLAL